MKEKKYEELHEKMAALGIKEDDLLEKFILGSGRGGQKLQKTHSCVYLKHVPSHIEVKCQKTRSQEQNRFFARRELCTRMENLLFQEKSAKAQEIAKIRKQKQRRTRKTKEKLFESKQTISRKKNLRKPPQELL